jgi:hypothetical protein
MNHHEDTADAPLPENEYTEVIDYGDKGAEVISIDDGDKGAEEVSIKERNNEGTDEFAILQCYQLQQQGHRGC